jgi:hypothetical protein
VDFDGVPLFERRRDRLIGASLGGLVGILDVAIAAWSGRDEKLQQLAAATLPAMLVVGWFFAPRAVRVTWRGAVAFFTGIGLLVAAITAGLHLVAVLAADVVGGIGVPSLAEASELVDNTPVGLLLLGGIFAMFTFVTWVWTLPFALLWVVSVRIAVSRFGAV